MFLSLTEIFTRYGHAVCTIWVNHPVPLSASAKHALPEVISWGW